ncbi:tetratricopeptide repeat protein [Chryseobacterium glaciei]|nr:tetratricopeptide repeat protein [Chryseobacterium glaciei]
MKKLLIIFILIFSIKGFSQDSYFLGKTNYCTPEKAESKKNFELGIKALQYPEFYEKATRILVLATDKDPKYCDAFFLAGYLLRLQDKHEDAIAYYYVADSLAQNKAPIFKQNLAIEFMRFGKADEARKKYEEMVKYFPTDPEGYYGIANTSIMLADYDKGLENLKKAEDLYKNTGGMKDDGKYMYGMLYSLKGSYEEALPYLEDVYSTYKKDDNYLALYALSQIKVGKSKNDEKLIKKAKNTYDKIKDKPIVEDISKKLKEEFS